MLSDHPISESGPYIYGRYPKRRQPFYITQAKYKELFGIKDEEPEININNKTNRKHNKQTSTKEDNEYSGKTRTQNRYRNK
jgi:hypothetical protein